VNYFVEVTRMSEVHGAPDELILVAIHDICRVLPATPGIRKHVVLVVSSGDSGTLSFRIKESYDALIQLLLKSDGVAIGR